MRLSKAEMVTLLRCVRTELNAWKLMDYQWKSAESCMDIQEFKTRDGKIGKRIESLKHLRYRLNIELRKLPHAK